MAAAARYYCGTREKFMEEKKKKKTRKTGKKTNGTRMDFGNIIVTRGDWIRLIRRPGVRVNIITATVIFARADDNYCYKLRRRWRRGSGGRSVPPGDHLTHSLGNPTVNGRAAARTIFHPEDLRARESPRKHELSPNSCFRSPDLSNLRQYNN